MTSNINTIAAPIMGINRHRLSTDGRGVTTLVGLHGCPLRCCYCLNNNCHTPTGVWKQMTTQELYDVVIKDDIYFRSTGGGITFGGGEPALHSAFIEQFAQLNKHQWNITIESSLNVARHHIEQIANVVNNYIIDIKTLNPDTYRAYTGQDIEPVMNNLHYLISRGKSEKTTIRLPLIPCYNSESDIESDVNKLSKMGFVHFDFFTYHTNPNIRPNPDGKQGKSVCNVLKRIRSIIAEANHITYTPTPCPHTTCTVGNCPKCEQELLLLTQQIDATENAIL